MKYIESTIMELFNEWNENDFKYYPVFKLANDDTEYTIQQFSFQAQSHYNKPIHILVSAGNCTRPLIPMDFHPNDTVFRFNKDYKKEGIKIDTSKEHT